MSKSRVLVSLMVIALAAAMIGGATMAWFTSEVTVEGNLFEAGTLEIGLVNGGSAVIDVGNMAPGDDVTGEVAIRNDGSLDMKFKGVVTETDADPGSGEDGYLPDALNVTVTLTDINESSRSDVVYEGTLAALLADPDLMEAWEPATAPDDPFEPGWTATYEIEVEFDEGAGNEYKNAEWKGDITFVATQWTNPGWDQ